MPELRIRRGEARPLEFDSVYSETISRPRVTDCVRSNADVIGEPCLKRWDWQCLRTPALCLFAALMVVPWSVPVYELLHSILRWLPLSSFFSAAVQFTSWFSILAVGLLITRFDKRRSRYLVYLACALAAMVAVNEPLKQIAGRSRPEWSVDMSKNKHRELVEFNNVHEEFHVPLARADHWWGPAISRPYFMDRYASFPSGHAATAFVLAAFLTVLYPAERKYWIFAAIACALSRIYGERHFVEDVLVGGAIGWGIAMWAFSWNWPLLFQDQIVQTWRQIRTSRLKNWRP